MRAVMMILALALACGGCPEPTEEPPDPRPEVSVMTFNVFCSFCGDENWDSWSERVGHFDDLFSRHDPDLIGLQELAIEQDLVDFEPLMEGYELVYWGPVGEFPYPDATIAFKTERWELADSGFYWLGPTPDEPQSGGWVGPSLVRLVAWVTLTGIDGSPDLSFITTHFDPNNPNQEYSAPLFLERTEILANDLPTIATGDFNSDLSDEAFVTMVEGVDGAGFKVDDAFELAPDWSITHNQAAEPDYVTDNRIDHIFVAGGGITTLDWKVDLTLYGPEDRPPSDHDAMVARFNVVNE